MEATKMGTGIFSGFWNRLCDVTIGTRRYFRKKYLPSKSDNADNKRFIADAQAGTYKLYLVPLRDESVRLLVYDGAAVLEQVTVTIPEQIFGEICDCMQRFGMSFKAGRKHLSEVWKYAMDPTNPNYKHLSPKVISRVQSEWPPLEPELWHFANAINWDPTDTMADCLKKVLESGLVESEEMETSLDVMFSDRKPSLEALYSLLKY